MQPYIKSKVLAERAAWDFIDREGGSLEISDVNPVDILGRVLGPDISASIAFKRLLEGAPPLPGLSFGMVDVRDLADLHILAMTAEAARGQRFIGVSGDVVTLFDIGKTLREKLGELTPMVQTPEMEKVASAPVPKSTSDKAMRVLGWRPRPEEETIIDTARSLFRYGVVSSA
ncbi:hypothetical protein [Rhizobium sp. YK2]|uniref:hypothetical protein n=1 Tax=Rhizobium sp. YK2 TaxID=1860096 RepID=UPI0026D325CE